MAKKDRKFWPHHVLKAGFLMLIVFIVIATLAYKYRVPIFSADHPEIIPNADDGMSIPQPEWYSLFFWQPFWYLTGQFQHLRPVFTFYVPVIFGLILLSVPFVVRGMNTSTLKKMLINIPAIIIVVLIVSLTIKGGYGFKAYGCVSCHNKYLGVRQALPPMDIAKFYREERARMIASGKYRAGKRDENASLSIGGTESYKDANWQMRHGYEPTFTW